MKYYEIEYSEIFNMLEIGLKKYNLVAYNTLKNEYYPKFKEGKFDGDVIEDNGKYSKYVLKLPTDSVFAKIHGDVKLHYIVYENNNVVVLNSISPEDVLMEGYKNEFKTNNGIDNISKDMFTTELLDILNDDYKKKRKNISDNICSKCEMKLENWYEYCPYCGHKCNEEVIACDNCGREVKTDYKYCPYCGLEFD